MPRFAESTAIYPAIESLSRKWADNSARAIDARKMATVLQDKQVLECTGGIRQIAKVTKHGGLTEAEFRVVGELFQTLEARREWTIQMGDRDVLGCQVSECADLARSSWLDLVRSTRRAVPAKRACPNFPPSHPSIHCPQRSPFLFPHFILIPHSHLIHGATLLVSRHGLV
jgi:hypothetical protein